MRVQLEMRLDHKEGVRSLDARKVAKAITLNITILREIEKNMTGKRPKIVWAVNVFTTFGATIIQFGSDDPNAATINLTRKALIPVPEGATDWDDAPLPITSGKGDAE